MGKKPQQDEYCPISEATKTIGDFWNILILRALMTGCQRFNQLQDGIDGITSATLSDRLKKLAEADLVERKQYESIPPKVEYTLTKKGRDLEKTLAAVEEFAYKYYSA